MKVLVLSATIPSLTL